MDSIQASRGFRNRGMTTVFGFVLRYASNQDKNKYATDRKVALMTRSWFGIEVKAAAQLFAKEGAKVSCARAHKEGQIVAPNPG